MSLSNQLIFMKQKVLIVEDERLIAQHIAQLLKNHNYQICAIASDAETALKKVVDLHPDLILLDIRIKGEIDGVGVAQQIKLIDEIPIIYLTAFSDLETLKKAQSTHPVGYLIKPFRSQELLSMVGFATANPQANHQDLLP